MSNPHAAESAGPAAPGTAVERHPRTGRAGAGRRRDDVVVVMLPPILPDEPASEPARPAGHPLAAAIGHDQAAEEHFLRADAARLKARRLTDWSDPGGTTRAALATEEAARTEDGRAARAAAEAVRAAAADPRHRRTLRDLDDDADQAIREGRNADAAAIYWAMVDRMAAGERITVLHRYDRSAWSVGGGQFSSRRAAERHRTEVEDNAQRNRRDQAARYARLDSAPAPYSARQQEAVEYADWRHGNPFFPLAVFASLGRAEFDGLTREHRALVVERLTNLAERAGAPGSDVHTQALDIAARLCGTRPQPRVSHAQAARLRHLARRVADQVATPPPQPQVPRHGTPQQQTAARAVNRAADRLHEAQHRADVYAEYARQLDRITAAHGDAMTDEARRGHIAAIEETTGRVRGHLHSQVAAARDAHGQAVAVLSAAYAHGAAVADRQRQHAQHVHRLYGEAERAEATGDLDTAIATYDALAAHIRDTGGSYDVRRAVDGRRWIARHVLHDDAPATVTSRAKADAHVAARVASRAGAATACADRLRRLQQHLAAARTAAAGGDVTAAREHYQQAASLSPRPREVTDERVDALGEVMGPAQAAEFLDHLATADRFSHDRTAQSTLRQLAADITAGRITPDAARRQLRDVAGLAGVADSLITRPTRDQRSALHVDRDARIRRDRAARDLPPLPADQYTGAPRTGRS